MIILKFSVLLLCLFPLIRIIWDKPDLSFWILLNFYFNPGGLITKYFNINFLGRFNLTDIFMLGICLCLYRIRGITRDVKIGGLFKQYLNLLGIYLIYYFIVYGFIAPYLHNDLDYVTFLLKNRNILYGLIILFTTYYYAHRSLKYFYLVTLTVGTVILVMYFITLVTGLDLISYSQMERYRGSGMMRIGMSSYGLIVHLLPMAIVTFLVAKRRITISYRKILYFSGILMALTMLLTLSRRHILDILGMIVLGVMIISYLFNILKIKAIMKFLIPLFLLIIITSVALPKYVGHIIKITEDTLSLVATGEDTRGKGNYRISGTGDLLLVKKSIADDFLIGNGYTYLYWGNNGMATSPRGHTYAMMADAALEVPIYYSLFAFGIIGAILMILLYYKILRLVLFMMRNMKMNYKRYVYDPIFLIVSLFVLLYFTKLFTLDLYNFGMIFHKMFVSNSVVIGIAFALYQQMRNKSPINIRGNHA